MMSTQRWVRRMVVAALVGASVVAVTATSAPDGQADAQAATGLGAGGEFHPLTPFRAFDSRKPAIDDTTPKGKKPHVVGHSAVQGPAGRQGRDPANTAEILAVVANVTVVEPTQAGWLAVQPTGAAAGKSALVNFAPGRNVPNLAFVGVGADGTMTVKLASGVPGSAHVVVDVFGWISTSLVRRHEALG